MSGLFLWRVSSLVAAVSGARIRCCCRPARPLGRAGGAIGFAAADDRALTSRPRSRDDCPRAAAWILIAIKCCAMWRAYVSDDCVRQPCQRERAGRLSREGCRLRRCITCSASATSPAGGGGQPVILLNNPSTTFYNIERRRCSTQLLTVEVIAVRSLNLQRRPLLPLQPRLRNRPAIRVALWRRCAVSARPRMIEHAVAENRDAGAGRRPRRWTDGGRPARHARIGVRCQRSPLPIASNSVGAGLQHGDGCERRRASPASTCRQ